MLTIIRYFWHHLWSLALDFGDRHSKIVDWIGLRRPVGVPQWWYGRKRSKSRRKSRKRR